MTASSSPPTLSPVDAIAHLREKHPRAIGTALMQDVIAQIDAYAPCRWCQLGLPVVERASVRSCGCLMCWRGHYAIVAYHGSDEP
jgi:hypothetical protein